MGQRKAHLSGPSFFVSLLLSVAALVCPTKVSAEDVTMWVYHNFPPYTVDAEQKEGLSFVLAQALTEMSEGKFQFNVVILPRQRLDELLINGEAGIVLWANPIWFRDRPRKKYLWTNPVLPDKNAVISPKALAFQYHGPNSLKEMTFVGVNGHIYEGIDPLVAAGEVTRIDLTTEEALVRFIASERGQVAIVANTAAQYFVQKLMLEADIHFSDQPHTTYQRHILVHPDLGDVHLFLQDVLGRLVESESWVDTVETYGLRAAPLR